MVWFAKEYNPVRIGSIDGTDDRPHDHGIVRAINANYSQPVLDSNPNATLFVFKLPFDTNEKELQRFFERYGRIKNVKLICDIVTGEFKGYGFIEFEKERDCEYAYKKCFKCVFKDKTIYVDYERERIMKGWVPRRFGGGLGGRKESGQLRCGGRHKPFKDPIRQPEFRIDRTQFRDDVWKQIESTEPARDRNRDEKYHSDRRKRSRSPSEFHSGSFTPYRYKIKK